MKAEKKARKVEMGTSEFGAYDGQNLPHGCWGLRTTAAARVLGERESEKA